MTHIPLSSSQHSPATSQLPLSPCDIQHLPYPPSQLGHPCTPPPHIDPAQHPHPPHTHTLPLFPPTSLLLCMIETRTVFGVRAATTSSGDTRPQPSTPTAV